MYLKHFINLRSVHFFFVFFFNWGKSVLIAMMIKNCADCGVNDPNSLPYIYLIEQRGIKRTKRVWEPTLKAAEVS